MAGLQAFQHRFANAFFVVDGIRRYDGIGRNRLFFIVQVPAFLFRVGLRQRLAA